ncbi:hypothetical protein EUGRSUZ_E02784 [Eucalyptus grandis]|uniref:Uncharacterized protein n=2 Tax=Eucalyptus grandis TaxID=71139 RepID=A0ACC3L011_EUCGR|nr:hypothetical protein EUGRSUZ_E02784 [Eucalyptus grandis]
MHYCLTVSFQRKLDQQTNVNRVVACRTLNQSLCRRRWRLTSIKLLSLALISPISRSVNMFPGELKNTFLLTGGDHSPLCS